MEKQCRSTPEYDLRFSRYFGTSPGFWLRLQLDYDLMCAERKNGERIQREVQPHAAWFAGKCCNEAPDPKQQ